MRLPPVLIQYHGLRMSKTIEYWIINTLIQAINVIESCSTHFGMGNWRVMVNFTFIKPSRLLSDVLLRNENNFDILRLIAAAAVIIGHAYAIAPQPPLQDFVSSLLHFEYSGSLAVKFFFFLSGLLVTDSIIRRPEPLQFLVRRACRIFPGLFLCLLISVFIVGPVFTKLSMVDYFTQKETWDYLIKNITLIDLQWKLPYVFIDSQYGLNGSLWSLPYESMCYLYIAIFCGFGLFSVRFAANVFCGAIIGMAFLAPNLLPRFAQNPNSHMLPVCFLLGVFFAINKHKIKINVSNVILLWLLVTLVNLPNLHRFLFYVAFFYTTIFLASLKFVINRFKLPLDVSYGVYIYGFMIQQCVHALFPMMGVHGNQFISLMLALFAGILSWYLVEKNGISFGNKITSIEWMKTNGDRARTILQSIQYNYLQNQLSRRFQINIKSLFIFCFIGLLATSLTDHFLIKKSGVINRAAAQNKGNPSINNFKIINWGPQETTQGIIPNLQADGSAGIWIQCLDGTKFGDVQVVLDDLAAKTTTLSKDLITASISAESFKLVGEKNLYIKQINTGQVIAIGKLKINPK